MPHLYVTTNKNRSKSRVSRKTGPPTRGAKKCPTKKQERKRAKRKSKRDMMTAMKSLDEYESHAPFETSDKVKDATRAMMNIVEAVSEKGKMTDNQYLEMMNHLLKIHKSEDTPTIGRRIPRWTTVQLPAWPRSAAASERALRSERDAQRPLSLSPLRRSADRPTAEPEGWSEGEWTFRSGDEVYYIHR
jgi:hypothetical protein